MHTTSQPIRPSHTVPNPTHAPTPSEPNRRTQDSTATRWRPITSSQVAVPDCPVPSERQTRRVVTTAGGHHGDTSVTLAPLERARGWSVGAAPDAVAARGPSGLPPADGRARGSSHEMLCVAAWHGNPKRDETAYPARSLREGGPRSRSVSVLLLSSAP
jgi:hypothetical protein